MKREWREFGRQIRDPSGKAPPHLALSIVGRVREELVPSVSRVLAKLGIIHALVSIGTLSVCPQFGYRLFGEGMGLMHGFQVLGHYGCAIACGTFFLGSSLALSATFFSRPEWRAIRERRVLTLTALLLPSLGFFRMMNGEFFLDSSIAWLVGAVMTGGALLEGVWRLKAQRT